MMDNTKDYTIGIIGLGLIGASILKDINRHLPEANIYGISKGLEQKAAQREGLIDKKAISLKDMADVCDVIFITTPIESVVDVARDISRLKTSKKKLVVTDAASVKSQIYPVFEELSSDVIEFIPSHPMGGSEKLGYASARGGLFRQKPWIICQKEQTSSGTLLADLLKRCCGAQIHYISPEAHDKSIAIASHMILDLSSFIFDFVSSKHPEVLNMAGESFITTTRLASDNPAMLASINANNTKNIQNSLNEFIEFLESKTRSLDKLEVDYFSDNKKARDTWLHHRNKQSD